MAEAPISGSLGAMNSLLGKLDYLLKSQHLFRRPLKKDIELLKEDLERINTVLLKVSNEDDPSQTSKYWMKEVREVSYDIEDYIDRLMYSESKIGSLGVIPRLKISKLPSTQNRRPKIANQIQELRARLEDAAERHKRYALDVTLTPNNTLSSHIPYGRSITTHHEEASRLLVGIDDSGEKLIKLLDDGEKQLKVISVFGIGGIGKTTLVKQFFEDHAGQFGCRAFVRASRKPDTRSVLQSIISQTRCHHPFDACNVQDLISCLSEQLQNRRYLIVIDDLCDSIVWDILLRAFSDGNHSSRIITTTAVRNVAMTCCRDRSDYVLMMEPLNIVDSRKLFLTRVFGSEDKCPQQFEDASDEIIRKCGGVPLAIINIAGFLASQLPDKPDSWDYVQKSLGSSLVICPTTEGIVNAINLGYNGLPHCLKTCLQYITLYPENCTIWKDDLVRRWVAEGFINPKEGNDMEAIAESYFNELVYRGMIQPIGINYNYNVFSCTVHSLVLDLLINKSTEDNFVTKIDYSQDSSVRSNKVRRLLLFFSTAKYAAKPSGATLSQVRSLSFYGLIKCMPSIREFEFLRVLYLHFSGDYSGHIPFNLTGIHRLFQLRYLKVTCNFSLQLPTHIEGLYHLETLELDARGTPLPEDIVYLQHLLHLQLPPGTSLPDKMGRMRSLHTLKCFDLCSNSEDKVRDLEALTNLQELELICTTVPGDSLHRNLNALCSILGSFRKLKTLALVPRYSVRCTSTSVVIDSSSTSSPPVCLENFEMHPAICIFSGFPDWMRTLRRLCILKIAVTKFFQNDTDTLGGLPELTVFSLYVQRPTINQIIFNTGAFPALKCFRFRCAILSFAFMKEAMPNLRRLKICFRSNKGSIMPAGVMHLLNLQEVALRIGLPSREYNKKDLDSAFEVAKPWFKVTIGEHRRIPNLNIQYFNWAYEDDYVPTRSTIESSSHFDHGFFENTLHEYTNENPDSRLSKLSDMEITNSALLSSDAGDNVCPPKGEKPATDDVDVVSTTKGAIHTMSQISGMSNLPCVLGGHMAGQSSAKQQSLVAKVVGIDQVAKDSELEHKVSGDKQQGKLQLENDKVAEKYLDNAFVSNAAVPLTKFSYEEIKEATNNFHVTQKIGGGLLYSSVYKGHLRYTDVVIKIFNTSRTYDNEVKALSTIRHPNIVKLIGVCPEHNAAIYEFFSNGSLEDYLGFRPRYNREALPWRMRIRIAVDICRALLFLHSYKPKGIAHGNLNPGNVYLDDNYVAKLGYFHFLQAPPVFLDILGSTPTSQRDVYSLGQLLMCLLTDKSSIALKTNRFFIPESLYGGHVRDYWPPEYAKRLASLVMRCCWFNKEEHGPDLAKDIWPILQTMLMEVSPQPTSQQFPDKWRDPPAPYIAARTRTISTIKGIMEYPHNSGKKKIDEHKKQLRLASPGIPKPSVDSADPQPRFCPSFP